MSVYKLPIEMSKIDVYDFISPYAGTKGAANGKSVLVTGGGTGIGETVARYFAVAGATKVVLAGRRLQLLEQSKSQIDALKLPVEVIAVATDVTDPVSVANLFERSGHIDVLVNNAGAYGQGAKVEEGRVEEWWTAFDVNIKGTYIVTQQWLRSLKGGPGVVLSVSSRASHVTAPGLSSYQISKTALNRLNEFIHKENAEQGVIAIAYHPGGIPGTEIANQGPAWLQAALKDTTELAAATAVYLSTPRAAFLSGRYVNGKWDMEELEKLQDTIVANDLLKTRVTGVIDEGAPRAVQKNN